MGFFLVVEEAKVYREFRVDAESPAQAKELVERCGDTLDHSSHPVPGEREVVEVWIEEATVPVWQVDYSEDGLQRKHESEERGITSFHES